MSSPSNHDRIRRIQLLGRIACITGLLVAACLIFGGHDESRERPLAATSAASAERLVSLSSAKPDPTTTKSVGTRPIEEIRVGDRVLARNPEVTDAERAEWAEPNWNDWLHLSLQMPLASEEDVEESEPKILNIEILRPESWVLEQVSYIVRERESAQSNLAPLAPNLLGGEGLGERGNAADPSPPTSGLPINQARGAWLDKSANQATTQPIDDADLVPLSPLRPFYCEVALTAAVLDATEAELVGLTVEMDLPEMGAFGTAVVTDINPCPTIRSGKGQPVTATFSHPPSTQVLDVHIEGETDSIGVTDNHLFWSVDREQFIPIGQMEIGEQVQTYFGQIKRIAGQLPRPGPQVVYNLEVYGEHVYFVGEQGLLAHNTYTNPKMRDAVNELDEDGYRWYRNPLTNEVKRTRLKMEPDHIFAGDKIEKLAAQAGLTRKQELSLLTDMRNIMPLPRSANAAKGKKSALGFREIKGKPVSAAYRKWLRRKEKTAEKYIRGRIDEMVKQNAGN